MARILLRGGCVLTLGAKTPNLVEGDVLIEGSTVAEVGRGLRARDAEVVDAAGTIVMPGFVDTHRHAWKSLLRNAGSGVGGEGGMQAEAFRRHYGADDVYAATLLSLLSAVEVGITTVVDWADVPADGQCLEASLQAHADSGARTVLVHAAPGQADGASGQASARRDDLAATPGSGGPPISRMAFGGAAPVSSDLDRVEQEWRQAREAGARIHTHTGVAPGDRGVVAALAAKGLLAPDVTLVHCSTLGDDDLDAIAARGAAVAIAPSSEMARGLPPLPLQELIDRGIRPGLAVDDEIVAPGDLFAQMRAAQALQRARVFDAKLAGKAGLPHLLSTRDVIRYATVDGARVAGLGEETGSLEPGKQADIVVLRADRPNIFPINDPIGAVVWGMDASNVDWVFVAGRPLMCAGVLEADVERVRELAISARRRVASAMGDLVESGGSR